MRRGNKYLLFAGAGWLISAAGVFVIAILLFPEESRSSYFWQRVLWVILLLLWGASGLYLTASSSSNPRDHIERRGAIAPAVALVVTLYAAFSILVMLVHAFMPEGDFLNRLHLALQTALAMVAGLIFVFLSMAWTGGTAGLQFDRSTCASPRELHDLLAIHESQLHDRRGASSGGLASSIKQLRETLVNSLHDSQSLSNSSAYRAICQDVRNLCSSIAEASDRDGANGEVAALADRTRRILDEAKWIASQQVRR